MATARRLAAIMLADVVGYSRMIERDVPSFIARFRDDRENIIDPAISAHGGTISRMAGDGILAIFSSLVEAVKAAIVIQSELHAVNAQRSSDDEIVLRIGLNFGDIVVEDDNLHGEGINLAARLESLAHPGGIFTTSQVAELVDGKVGVPLRFVRTQKLKNIERPARIYEIQWQQDSSEQAPPKHPSAELRSRAPADMMSGRDAELSRLLSNLTRAIEGELHMALLAGEAGIGKTRLAHELSRLGAERSVQVYWGHCREDSGSPAYWPWRQLLLDMERRRSDIPSDRAHDLNELLETSPQREPDADVGGDQSAGSGSRFRMFHAVADRLRRLSLDSPVLIILDDLHRADSPSLRLLEFVTSELDQTAIMFLATYRDLDVPTGHKFEETLSELARLNRYEHIKLKNLSRQEVDALLESELATPSSQELGSRIFDRTGGHPLYVLETIRHLRQGGDSTKLPPSLRAIINQRLATLPERSLHVLNNAAVVGREFELTQLVELCDEEPTLILDALDEPARANQIEAQDSPGSYRFTHALIREALYDKLSGSERMKLHLKTGEVLEEFGADPAQIAYHYHQCAPLGMARKATEFSRRAAVQATRMFAFEEACRAYRQAIHTCRPKEKAELTFALAASQMAAGETMEAISAFDAAADLAHAADDFSLFLKAAIGLEEATFRPGLPGDLAVKKLNAALEWEGVDLAPEQRIRLLCSLARAYALSGHPEKLWSLQSEAEALSRKIGDRRLLVRTLMTKGSMTAINGLSSERFDAVVKSASEAAAEAIDLSRELNESGTTLEVLSHAVPLFMAWGKRRSLSDDLAEHGALAEARKQPFYIYEQVTMSGALELARGNLGVSEALAQRALEMSRFLPEQNGEGVFGIQMFNIRREQGRLHEFRSAVEFFVSRNPEATTWRPGLALVYAEVGELEKSRELLESLAAVEFRDIPRDALWSTSIAYLSEVSARLEHASATLLYEQLVPFASLNVILPPVATAGSSDRFLGLLACAMHELGLAEQHFRDAIASNEQQGFVTWTAHTKLDFSAMLKRRGQAGDLQLARQLREEALGLCTGLGLVAVEKAAGALDFGDQLESETTRPTSEPLSRRELQVLAQIATGKDNRDIGATLFISPNTVAAHVRNILAKTRTSNRTEAAAFANQHGLLAGLPGTK